MSHIRSNNSKPINSNYQSLYLWTSFLLGMISLGFVIWNRRQAPSVALVNQNVISAQVDPQENIVIPAKAGIQSSSLNLGFLNSRLHGNNKPAQFFSTYQINLSSFASSFALSTFTYQLSGNPIVGLLSSWPLFLTALVAAQSSGLRIVVPEFRVNSNTMSSQDNARVASLSAEEWVVVWQGRQTGNWNIYAQRYVLNGNVLGPEFRVNNNTARDKGNSAVASLNSGEWVVAWQSSQTNNYDIYAQRFVANGSAVGPEFRVNSNTVSDQGNPAVANLNSGEWVAVWIGVQAGVWNIYGQRYAQNGTTVGPEFQVNSNTTASRNYPPPAVASLSSGEWVVVWQGYLTGDADIYGQRYAQNGSAVGPEFRANSNTTGSRDYPPPTVASLSSGEWVVVWQGNQTGNRDIYGQRYALNGSAIGSEFRVNSNNTGDQTQPSVASLSSAGWVVVWTSTQTGNSDIYGQRYALNGSAIGSEFQVNSNIKGDQTYPSVASLSSEEWVVVWTGTQTGNSDVYGSIFSSVESAPILTTTLSTPSTTRVATSSSSLTTTTVNTFTMNLTSSASSMQQTMTTTNNDTQTKSTEQQAPSTNDKSGTNGTTIGIAAGVAGAIGLGACAAAIGFYACRKKGRANKVNNVVEKKTGMELRDTQGITSTSQNYARLDEVKKPENQYDNAPKLEI